MTVRTIAWRDVVDARAGSLVPLCLGMAAIFAGIVATTASGPAVGTVPTAEVLSGLALAIGPYAAVVVAHESVAAERTNQTVRLSLSLPHRRRDLVLGLFLGRWAILAVLLGVGVLAGGLAAFAVGRPADPIAVLAVLPVAVVLTGTFTGIAVGVSATTDSTTSSFVGGLLVAAICLGWSGVPGALRYVLAGFTTPTGPRPAWAEALLALDPLPAVADLLGAVSSSAVADPSAGPIDAALGLAVLLVWLAAPLALGIWRFGRAEL